MKEWERRDQGHFVPCSIRKGERKKCKLRFQQTAAFVYTLSLSPLVKYIVAAALAYLCEMTTVMAAEPVLVDALLTRTKRKRGMAFWQCYG